MRLPVCRLLCMTLTIFLVFPAATWAQEADLNLLVLSGEGAINNVEKRVVTEPIVEVQDGSGRPLEGVKVTFRFPPTGPSATFYGASRTLTVTTDGQGRARAGGMTPNTELGSFVITVKAVHGRSQAETSITQTNALAPGLAKKKKNIFGWRLISAIGAGVAIGVIAGVRRSDSDTNVPTTAVTFGSVSVGSPR